MRVETGHGGFGIAHDGSVLARDGGSHLAATARGRCVAEGIVEQ